MSIANPLVVTINAVEKSLAKINQDNYGSEYYLREATQDFRVKIRHQKENQAKNGNLFDRHNVELTQTIFATEAGTPDNVIQVYVVLRGRPTEPALKQGYLLVALGALFSSGIVAADLVGWQN